MANCKNPECNANVGCGCNLKDGYCATCYAKYKAMSPPPPPINKKK